VSTQLRELEHLIGSLSNVLNTNMGTFTGSFVAREIFEGPKYIREIRVQASTSRTGASAEPSPGNQHLLSLEKQLQQLAETQLAQGKKIEAQEEEIQQLKQDRQPRQQHMLEDVKRTPTEQSEPVSSSMSTSWTSLSDPVATELWNVQEQLSKELVTPYYRLRSSVKKLANAQPPYLSSLHVYWIKTSIVDVIATFRDEFNQMVEEFKKYFDDELTKHIQDVEIYCRFVQTKLDSLQQRAMRFLARLDESGSSFSFSGVCEFIQLGEDIFDLDMEMAAKRRDVATLMEEWRAEYPDSWKCSRFAAEHYVNELDRVLASISGCKNTWEKYADQRKNPSAEPWTSFVHRSQSHFRELRSQWANQWNHLKTLQDKSIQGKHFFCVYTWCFDKRCPYA
jgi:hypothetical protein